MIPGHRILGDGPCKAIVLPGWFGCETLLDPIAGVLDLAAHSYAVLAYRGYGASRTVPGAYTLDEIATDALALADGLGWARFALIGHSMGGKAAQAVLARAGGRVRGIIAIAPVPATPVPFDAATWALFTGAADRIETRADIIHFATGSRLTRTWSRAMAERSWATSDKAAFAAYLDAWALGDVAVADRDAQVPLLAIVGAQDPQLTEVTIRATYLTRFANGECLVIGDAGHYPLDETPIIAATAIETFLDLALRP